jgi:hypothetical protein
LGRICGVQRSNGVPELRTQETTKLHEVIDWVFYVMLGQNPNLSIVGGHGTAR